MLVSHSSVLFGTHTGLIFSERKVLLNKSIIGIVTVISAVESFGLKFRERSAGMGLARARPCQPLQSDMVLGAKILGKVVGARLRADGPCNF